MAGDAAVRPGRLVIVGTPIGNLADLGGRARQILARVDVVAAEDTRRARWLLSRLGVRGTRLISVRQHNERQAADRVLGLLDRGLEVAYVTDAGMPTISDPGRLLVDTVSSRGHPVAVVPGPDAATSALACSGFGGGRWIFEGFLPRKGRARAEALEVIRAADVPVVLFESPRRLGSTLVDLAAVVGDERPICVCNDLTKRYERVVRGTISSVGSELVEPRGEYVLVIDGAEPTLE